MCDAVTASIVATVAGSAAQAAGQARARSAMQGAQQAERTRQRGFQDQSQSAFSESLAHANPQDQANAQAGAEANRKAAYEAASAQAHNPIEATGKNFAGNQNANRVLNSESSARNSQAQGFANQQGAAKAALQGFGDVQLGNALYNARQMQNQGTIGNFMQGSAGILPYEVEAASHKGDQLKNIGDLLSMGGAIAGLGAGAGWWGGADKAAQAAGTLGSAGSNASNLATLGANNVDLAKGTWDFGGGLSNQYNGDLFNLTPKPIMYNQFYNPGSILSNVRADSLARYVPIK
jgi:hypothetical protein